MSDILSTDELVMMNEEDLLRRYSSLTGFIERERRRGVQNNQLEAEHCYLYREIEVRNERKRAHVEWLNNGGHLHNYDTEYEA